MEAPTDSMVAEPLEKRAPRRMVQFFEHAELILYGAVGILLVVIALIALVAEVHQLLRH